MVLPLVWVGIGIAGYLAATGSKPGAKPGKAAGDLDQEKSGPTIAELGITGQPYPGYQYNVPGFSIIGLTLAAGGYVLWRWLDD